jgi:hypothetical protein
MGKQERLQVNNLFPELGDLRRQRIVLSAKHLDLSL